MASMMGRTEYGIDPAQHNGAGHSMPTSPIAGVSFERAPRTSMLNQPQEYVHGDDASGPIPVAPYNPGISTRAMDTEEEKCGEKDQHIRMSCLRVLFTPDKYYNCDNCDPNNHVLFPKRTIMWGCRKCDWDSCEKCFKAANPLHHARDVNMLIGAKYLKNRKLMKLPDAAQCGQKDTTITMSCLIPLLTPDKYYNCDNCDPENNVLFPKRTLMFGCRTCDWDACEACFKKNNPALYVRHMYSLVTTGILRNRKLVTLAEVLPRSTQLEQSPQSPQSQKPQSSPSPQPQLPSESQQIQQPVQSQQFLQPGQSQQFPQQAQSQQFQQQTQSQQTLAQPPDQPHAYALPDTNPQADYLPDMRRNSLPVPHQGTVVLPLTVHQLSEIDVARCFSKSTDRLCVSDYAMCVFWKSSHPCTLGPGPVSEASVVAVMLFLSWFLTQCCIDNTLRHISCSVRAHRYVDVAY